MLKIMNDKTRALDGWMDEWMGAKARLRIAYSNQKNTQIGA